MKKIIFIVSIMLIIKIAAAQTKPAGASIPDANKIMKMSPAEIEAYKKQVLGQTSKQVKKIAEESNSKINEMALPDYELEIPVKDVKRLLLLPSQPPTMNEMLNDLKKSIQQIEMIAPNEINKAYKQYSTHGHAHATANDECGFKYHSTKPRYKYQIVGLEYCRPKSAVSFKANFSSC